MSIDPAVQAYLDDLRRAGVPDVVDQTVEQARATMESGVAALGAPEQVANVENARIPSPAGEIPVRVYRPRGGTLPAVVFFHGGGWVIGSVDTHDGLCRALANATGAALVSVEYRLAPEHKYPAALEDGYAVVSWLAEHGAPWQIDSSRLAVMGDSAGGNLSAAVALACRDRQGPPLRHQTLLYPVCDSVFETPSYLDNAAGFMLTRAAMQWFWQHYARSAADYMEPYAAVLRAADLSRLPPALVITAEYDPLRDEAEAYARRLQAAGVPTKLTRYDGQIHGFMRRMKFFTAARVAIDEVAAALKAAMA